MAQSLVNSTEPDPDRFRAAIMRVHEQELRDVLLEEFTKLEAKTASLQNLIDHNIATLESKTEQIKLNIEAQNRELESTQNRIAEQKEVAHSIKRRMNRNIFEAGLVAVSMGLFAGVMAQYGEALWLLIRNTISLIFITKAHAIEASAGLLSSSKDYILLSVLGVVSLIYITCFVILVFVSEKDSKEFAKDIIKTITGFYLGLLTKSF